MRLPDWRDRLHNYLDGCRDTPFSWGSHSCLSFATGAVVAMTGTDPWAEDRAKIEALGDRWKVLRYMARYADGDLRSAAEKALLLCAVKRKYPGEGDIVLAEVGGIESVGVCLGRFSAFVGCDGVVCVKPDRVLESWGIA